jgi:hypothetical protein
METGCAKSQNLYNNMIIIIAVRASNLINIIDNKQ